MLSHRCVLIIDRSDESRTVLRTALERRGVAIIEAESADRGLDLARQHQPDLVVLDLEVSNDCSDRLEDRFAEILQPGQSLLVLSGIVARGRSLEDCHFLSKPYHYGPLILKIETLLNQAERSADRGLAVCHPRA